MVISMTAFSRKDIVCTWGTISWEIRSLNQRYLDIYIDLPKNFIDLSWIIRKKIKSCLFRGKIECNLKLDINNDLYENIIIDVNLINHLINAAELIKFKIKEGSIDPLKILSFPGVFSYKRKNGCTLNNELLSSFDNALIQLLHHRKDEGFFLKQQITNRLHQISQVIDNICEHMPNVLKKRQKKFSSCIQNFGINVDPIRLEQELLIIAQKTDISEEIDRLTIHVKSIYNLLSKTGPIGRKLDFISQELQREANTLASKSVDINITHLAIDLKVFIEQIREQAQNIE